MEEYLHVFQKNTQTKNYKTTVLYVKKYKILHLYCVCETVPKGF